jgi:hypothetical protein
VTISPAQLGYLLSGIEWRHVWTVPVAQGVFGSFGRWSGAVMCPACLRGR